MKNIFNIIFTCFILFGLSACDPQEDKAKDMGNTYPAGDIKVIVTPDATTSNLYHFELASGPFIGGIFKCEDANIDVVGMSFSQKILFEGDYTLNVQVYNKAGISETKSVTVSVPQNDPKMYEDVDLMNLTGGDEGKTWIIASELPGHIGCGPSDSNNPDWWSAGANELAARNIYDDELSFVLSRESQYKLITNGKIFVNESAAKTMAPTEYPNGSAVAVVVNYTQPAGQKWGLIKDGGKLYLKFSANAFPSYVANPDALGARYEVIKLTPTELHLKWAGNGINWYYKFKVKS